RGRPSAVSSIAFPRILGRCGSGPIWQLISAGLVDLVATDPQEPSAPVSAAGVAVGYHSRRPLCGVRNICSGQPLDAYLQCSGKKSCPTTKQKHAKTDARLTLAKSMNFGIGATNSGYRKIN